MTEPTQCPVCDPGLKGGALCKQHRQDVDEALAGIQDLSRDLDEAVKRRKRHGGTSGHAHPAFPPTPISIPMLDLQSEAHDDLQMIASDAGWWPPIGSDLHDIARGLRLRLDMLSRCPSIRTDYRQVRAIASKLQARLTPPSERLIIGRCLNPPCRRPIGITDGQDMATCDYCGSSWTVQTVIEDRYRRMASDQRTYPTRILIQRLADEGIRLKSSTLRSWVHRRLLTPVLDGDEPEYRASDVITLMKRHMTRAA